MNKKGQALIEFILIIPIFVMLVLAVFDYTKIMQSKMHLEDIAEELSLNKNPDIDDNIKISISENDNKKTYKLNTKVNISSTFLTPIIGKNYNVEVTRVVYE